MTNAANVPSRVAVALRAIQRDYGSSPVPALSTGDAAALAAATPDDDRQLKCWIKRRLMGDPLAYIIGAFDFRGRRFHLDRRAYITDPETSLLVDHVIAAADAFTAKHGRAPVIAELGCGSGSLMISVKLDRPAVTVIGLDLDRDALAVAERNLREHGAEIALVESDLFDAWPLATQPDIVFGDPPWGSDETLYDGARDGSHYHAMPPASAFPVGGRTGVHTQILRAVSERGWTSHIILNGGVLPPVELTACAHPAASPRVDTSADGISILHCSFA